MIRVLYAGVANLARPSVGLEFASRCHFEEISADNRLDVTAISVSHFPVDPVVPARYPAQMFTTDSATLHTSRQRFWKKLALLTRGGMLFQSGFLSERARALLRSRLRERPDVLLIDHIGALASIPLLQLLGVRLRGRSKIMVIAHDTTAEVLRDRAALATSKLRAFAIRLHAMHCQLYESLVFALAHRVVFLSQLDRDQFASVPASKTEVMCLIIDEPSVAPNPDTATETELGQYFIFIGSPAFFANAYAINWLTSRFAPKLLQRMPAMKILLVGKGTDGANAERPGNMVALGFVDEDRLHRLLRESNGLLSPIVHGSGIKIKVLEAIASGGAVFATASSLRGYEFMGIEPMLDIDDPDGSIDRVCAIAGDPARLAAFKQQIETRWQSYKRERRGKLADIVCQLAAGHERTQRAIQPATPV